MEAWARGGDTGAGAGGCGLCSEGQGYIGCKEEDMGMGMLRFKHGETLE